MTIRNNESNKTTKKLCMYEVITSMIGYILKHISEREEMEFDWETLHHDGNMALMIALQEQE